MSSRSAVRLKALDQARQKLEDLTKQDVVTFTFIISEEGAEMMGEETLTNEVMSLFEEHGIMELARRIRMRGQRLTHRSTRATKIEQMQEAFSTNLPPTLLPLEDMTDYDLLRSLLNDVFKVEGFGTQWQPGDEPPATVKAWYGEEDVDILKLYRNQNLTKPLMDIIRERHPRYRKNAMLYWKEKLLSCYRHRLGEEMRKYHMNLPKEEVEAVKRERLRREEEEQNERRTAAEAEAEAELQRQRKEEFDARVERAVQIRERRRQEDMATSPERRRRRRGGLLADEGEVEESLGRGEQEVLLRRMVEVENLAQDQNRQVLLDPAALAVVRAPTARVEDFNAPGPARTSRQRHKCPVAGCPITRNSQEALNAHIENSHD